LPDQFVRCANCHASVGPLRPRSSLETLRAPPLNRASLTEMISRRGGPPFAYDRSSFCRTIKTGIDPQYVILARAMPRFEVDETQCDSLWVYLTNDRGPHERNEYL
jgi:hypothetical protein